MKLKQLPIRWKMTILSYTIVVFFFKLCGNILISDIQKTKEKEKKKKII